MTTTESPGSSVICTTCHKPHPWPDGTMPRHPFNGGDLSGVAALRPHVKVQQSSWPFDPVLRQALIDKGVLTPEDLTAAEAKIRAITGMMMGGNNDAGQPTSRA